MKERSDRLQEACELIRALFTADGPVDYAGTYYQLEQAPFSPGCYQTPHTPIMIGGTGERRTLRTLAMFGDIMNLDGWAGQGVSREVYRHKVSVLEQHCENVGRDPTEIKHTVLVPLVMSDDTAKADQWIQRFGEGTIAGPRSLVIDRIGELVDEGIDEIMFGNISSGDSDEYQRIEQEVVAAFD